MKAKTMTAKRRGREKQVTEMPEPEVGQQGQWRDLQPLLDQELNGLPENYRLPILLCDLEGQAIKEATQQLGWPQGTLAGRLARGRKLLAKRLANRGLVLSAASLVAVVSQNTVSAGVPTSVMNSTGKAATLIAAGQATVAGVVPAKVAALTEGVLKAMLVSKLKIATAMLLLTVGVLVGPLLLGNAQDKAADSPKKAQSGAAHPALPFTLKVGERYCFVEPTGKNSLGNDNTFVVAQAPSNHWVKVDFGGSQVGWVNLNHIMAVIPQPQRKVQPVPVDNPLATPPPDRKKP
jgi:RNA polymerase sigma-70 factor (ECF subfamily)